MQLLANILDSTVLEGVRLKLGFKERNIGVW